MNKKFNRAINDLHECLDEIEMSIKAFDFASAYDLSKVLEENAKDLQILIEVQEQQLRHMEQENNNESKLEDLDLDF